MNEITMPNFHKWAIRIAGLHCVYMLAGIQEALEQSFDQGRSLGQREGLTNTQEWWTEEDTDKQWIASHGELPTEE